MPRPIAGMLSGTSIGAPDMASPNHRLLRDAAEELAAPSGPAALDFWARFAEWYASMRPFWPLDGQFTRSWSAPQINHFFLTARLNPYVVACFLDEEVGVTLTQLVTAALEGLVVPRWALLCPWCSQSAVEVRALSAVPAQATCFLCQVTFEADLATNVVVTFQMHPKVHTVPIQNLPCPLPPPMQQRYLCEVLVGPMVGCVYDVSLKLVAGEYVLCCPLSGRTAVLKVREEGDHDGEDVVPFTHPMSPGVFQPESAEVRAGVVRIAITNRLPATLTRVFLFPMAVLQDSALRACSRPPYVTAFQLMHHPLWAPPLFGEPSPEQPMLASQCFMVFAAVSLPASLQDNVGADAARQECLALVEECTARHCGVVCEQAGEAVLASYLSGLQALAGTLEAMVRISHSSHPCGIRAGVHFGATMVECQEERRSLAGKEVGRTTLFHDAARPWQLVVSQVAFTLADLSTAVRCLRDAGVALTVQQRNVDIPGIPDPQPVYVIVPHCAGMSPANFGPACYAGCPLPLLRWTSGDGGEAGDAASVAAQQIAALQARVQELHEAYQVERERNHALLQEMEQQRHALRRASSTDRRANSTAEVGTMMSFDGVVLAIQQLQASVVSMAGQTGLQSEVDRLSVLVEEGAAGVRELETGVMRVNARLTARKSIQALESEHEALRQLLSDLMSQKASLNYEMETLRQGGGVDPALDPEEEVDRLKAAVQAKAAEQTKLAAEVERLSGEVQRMRAANGGRGTQAVSKLGDLQAALKAADEEEATLLRKLAELQSQLADGLAVAEALRRVEGQFAVCNDQLKELVALRAARQDADQRVAELEVELQSTQKELEVRAQRLTSIEAELGALQEELRILVTEGLADPSPALDMAEVIALREALAESEAQRQLLHEALMVTRSKYDQMQGQNYTATLQSQVRKLEEMIEDNNDEREAEHGWLLRHAELDLQRLCEEKAQLARELQRIQAQDPTETGSEYLQMMEKYRAYVRERQK